MRLQTSLLVAAAAAALTFNVCKSAHESGGPVLVSDIQIAPIPTEPDDELTITLRRQAQTAMADLQARGAHF